MDIKNNWDSYDFLQELEKSSLEKNKDYELEYNNKNQLTIKLNSFAAVKEFSPTDTMSESKYNALRTNSDINRLATDEHFTAHAVLDFNNDKHDGSVEMVFTDSHNKIKRGIILDPNEEKGFSRLSEDRFDDLKTKMNEINSLKSEDVAKVYGNQTIVPIKHVDVLPLETRLSVLNALNSSGSGYKDPEFISFNNQDPSEITVYKKYTNDSDKYDKWAAQTIKTDNDGKTVDFESSLNGFSSIGGLDDDKETTKKIQQKLGTYKPDENEVALSQKVENKSSNKLTN